MSNHKTTHTPGPWRVGDAGHTVFGPPNGKPAPQVIATGLQRGDAALIAAAPDMLAALRGLLATAEAVDAANKNQHGHNCAGFSSNLFEFCHAAIRRAGGEA